MSEHFAPTYNDCDGDSRRSMHSYHSAWMSHWTRRSTKESCHASFEYPSTTGVETASNACSPARRVADIKPGCSRIKSESLRMNSTIAGKGSRQFQPVPTGDPSKNSESTSHTEDNQACSDIGPSRAHQSSHNLVFESSALSLRCYTTPLLSVAPDANLSPFKEYHIQAEGTLQNTKELVETYPTLGNSSFTTLRPLSKNLNISSTEMMQRGPGQVNELISFFPLRAGRPALTPKDPLPKTKQSIVDSKKSNFLRHSTFMACEDKLQSHLKFARSLSYEQQKRASSAGTDPCKINSHLPASGQDKFLEKQNASGFRIFWNQTHHAGVAESENFYGVCSSSHKFQNSYQDLESLRICTTSLDSVVAKPEVQPKFSLISAKGTDLDSYKLRASLRNLRESAGFNRKALFQLRGTPRFGSGRKGVRIESLGSSSESEGKENVRHHLGKFDKAELLKDFNDSVNGKGKQVMDDLGPTNESSAETDAMDLDNFQVKNQQIGISSSRSSEVLKLSLETPQFAIGSTSKCKQHECKLTVTNLQFPALPALINRDASSSRTQSLDVGTLFTHSKSDMGPGGSGMLELGNRWIKRLKLSASEPTSFGTKYSNTEELSSHEKESSLMKSQQGRLSCSEPTINELHGKEKHERMVLDKTTAPVRSSESSSVDETQKERILALTSQSWIRRWCQKRSVIQQKKPESFVACEPHKSTLAFEDLQERQLPSVGAMALMGKAMRGFQPCDLQRKGPVVVWNTGNI